MAALILLRRGGGRHCAREMMTGARINVKHRRVGIRNGARNNIFYGVVAAYFIKKASKYGGGARGAGSVCAASRTCLFFYFYFMRITL